MAAAAYGALLAVGSTVQGIESNKIQRRALRGQEQAQREAQARAAQQLRQSQQEINAANRQQPDISALLAASRDFGLQGIGSTQLTGPLRSAIGTGTRR